MEKYLNHSGNSGVTYYEILSQAIKIKFKNNEKIYTYSYAYATSKHVEQMKILAKKGAGLATYIRKYVADLHDDKLM